VLRNTGREIPTEREKQRKSGRVKNKGGRPTQGGRIGQASVTALLARAGEKRKRAGGKDRRESETGL